MKKGINIKTVLMALTLSFGLQIFAEESTLEKAETAKNKVADSVRKTYRKMDTKICEKVNGKTDCVSKKIENKIKNTSDQIKTDTTEVINKVD